MGGCWQPRQQKGGNESVPEVKKNSKKQRLNQDNKKEHFGETSSLPPGDSHGSRSLLRWSIVLCYSAWLDVLTLRRLAWSTVTWMSQDRSHHNELIPVLLWYQVFEIGGPWARTGSNCYIKNMLIVIVTFKSLYGASLKNVDVASCHVPGVNSVCCSVAQACLTFFDPMDCSPLGIGPRDSPGKNTRVGRHALPQGIFPT